MDISPVKNTGEAPKLIDWCGSGKSEIAECR